VRAANKYFNDCEPWKVIKEDKAKCENIINNCLQICYSIAIIISPILPFTSERILKILNSNKKNFDWNKIGDIILKDGASLGENEILFPQLEIKKEEKTEEAKLPEEEQIDIDYFRKLKLRTAKIVECEVVPKSKKLLKLQLKVGEKTKQIVAGIAEHYKPEDLVGKTIIIVDNLKKTKLMGIESEGMLLAAKKDGKLAIVAPEKEIEDGGDVN
jgi:methionyl-tRNA synthetase